MKRGRPVRAMLSAWLLLASLTSRSTAQAFDTLPAQVVGSRVHVVSVGRGSPTVVLEAGFSSTSGTWASIQRDLGQTHRVIAYDRPCLGRSEPSSRPRASRAIAEDLRAALRSVGVAPPYLLVGHSGGGIHARVFAGMYPTEVLGLVLLDPAPEDFYPRAKREWPLVFAYFDSLAAAEDATASPGEVSEAVLRALRRVQVIPQRRDR